MPVVEDCLDWSMLERTNDQRSKKFLNALCDQHDPFCVILLRNQCSKKGKAKQSKAKLLSYLGSLAHTHSTAPWSSCLAYVVGSVSCYRSAAGPQLNREGSQEGIREEE